MPKESDKIKDLQSKIDELQKNLQDVKQPEHSRTKKQIYAKWESPARSYEKKERPWFIKTAFIAIILIVFGALLNDTMIIITISAVLLVLFLLAIVPPNLTKHEINSNGIKTAHSFFKWDNLLDFWIGEKYGEKVMYVKTKIRFPDKLTLILPHKEYMEIIENVYKYIPYKEFSNGKQNYLSKSVDGIYIKPEDLHLVEDLS